MPLLPICMPPASLWRKRLYVIVFFPIYLSFKKGRYIFWILMIDILPVGSSDVVHVYMISISKNLYWTWITLDTLFIFKGKMNVTSSSFQVMCLCHILVNKRMTKMLFFSMAEKHYRLTIYMYRLVNRMFLPLRKIMMTFVKHFIFFHPNSIFVFNTVRYQATQNRRLTGKRF